MSPKRRPDSTRVLRDHETVLARHQLLVSLWRQGLSLRECADVAGVASHQTAHYHISGKCRCGL